MSPPRRPSLVEVLRTLDPGQTADEALRDFRHQPGWRHWLEKERERLAQLGRNEGLPARPRDGLVAGADEVGRGPLAGPLVAAAVAFARQPWIPGLRDSKKLKALEREAMVPWIEAQAVSFSTEVVPVEVLNLPDGTLHSHSLAAMGRCVERLCPEPHLLFVDGRFEVAGLKVRQQAVVGGDDRCVTVAAASVLAKVSRDRIMADLDEVFPGYGFSRHKGYGTAEHLEALDRLGPCAAHRIRFGPVRVLRGEVPVQGLLDFGS